ncbi:MAG TPA: FHA domain-containing serine/threonine-protein kinase, partial [Polyangiaceae bacterium]|nr:FHA domain-containing serine/threonine-protein kinase [Polyangiaceae bacterium]
QEGRPLILGRGMTVDLPLPAEDSGIALRHAEVLVSPLDVQIHPLPNVGPVFVNGSPIENATRMVAGDSLQVGDTTIRLYSDQGPDSESMIEPIPLSFRDIIESARALRLDSQRRAPTPSGLASENLHCTGCGIAGIVPPRPDLWDAAWLCSACAKERRKPMAGMPARLGHYELLRPIARGGMGVVFEGLDSDTGLHVAIKILRSSGPRAERAAKRFAREQQITMALRHPNIVCCYDIGVWEGSLYIVSEFVPGGDALKYSSLTSPLQQVLWLGADLFRALGYGHDLGIVHRDVKPANLLLCPVAPQGTLRGKLGDYGLAKSRSGVGNPITMSNESGGSLLTIGPEQIEDFVNVGPQGDLYAGAATVFWMLTGDTPLVLPCASSSATFEQKAQAILHPARKRLLDLRGDVPVPVAELIDGLVAVDPSLRQRMHAREVAAAFNAIAARMVDKSTWTGSAPASFEASDHARVLKRSLEAVEFCVRMLERSVERAAKEVREAADTEDNQRMQRALANHESAQADLEQALTQWEGLLDADHGPRG